MADYQVVDREQLDADMTDVADHIRAKADISTPLEWPDGYKAAVDAIHTGVELPELTNPGAASDLLAGKELIGEDGKVVVGTAPERDSADLIVSNNGIIVPAGHYPKQASASLDSVELATPSIEVSDNGLITASVVQPPGYVPLSAKSQTKQLPVQAGKTVTPTTSEQTVVESGVFTTGDIKVAAMPTATQATPTISVSSSGLITANANQNAGYVAAGSKSATKQLTTKSAQTYTPGTSNQTISSGRYLTGTQTIKGDANLKAENIVAGVSIFGVEGTAETGGVEPPDSLALDPDVVYATTRPKDWLPMPTPGDDEIYVLLHIPDGLTGTFSANITSNGTVTAELGTVVDGNFVAKETLTISAAGTINKVIDSASYGNLTADGMKQCMVRIKGPVTIFNGVAAKGPHPGVEVVCGIKLTQIRFGYTATNERCWMNLRYVSFVGNGGAADLSQAFYFCTALVAIRCEAENIVTNLAHALRDCWALQAVSGNLAASTTPVDCSRFVDKCSLSMLPKFAIKASTLYYAFHNSSMLDMNFVTIDTSKCTSMNRAFLYGYSMRSIRNLDISSLADTTSMFSLLFNLNRLTFAGEATPGGFTIAVPALGLTRPALLETINSLPVATAAATLTITGCAGASELTDEDIAIATAKNWTITI